MSLSQTLLELSRRHMAALSPRERADIEDELDRLRMMRVAEDGLAAGDPLPDFSLEDGAGRVWTSGELLDHGPLVLALFRGGWCPYCDLTMLALEDARPAIEALGATAVGVMPGGRDFPAMHREPIWHLPVPAVFVVEPSARVAWAFSDVDPARWPDPQELLASLEALRNAHALSNR